MSEALTVKQVYSKQLKSLVTETLMLHNDVKYESCVLIPIICAFQKLGTPYVLNVPNSITLSRAS